jgi:hypothetical protein
LTHLAIAALHGWLAVAIGRPRRWIRRVTTVTLLIGAVAGYVFLKNSSALIPTQIIGVTLEQVLSLGLRLVALWLLWGQREVRHLFAVVMRSDPPT